MKTHWLYGFGTNKEVKFKKEINQETKCQPCLHRKVCSFNMEKRCVNYEWGTSEHKPEHCYSCVHHYTRFDKDSIPCFRCNDFLKKKAVVRQKKD